ncbi:hypothetical protein [Nonomuraea sp. NPDC002799]
MYASKRSTAGGPDRHGGLSTPRRNRYFHGKLLDVYHFELETAYFLTMSRLMNRLVVGPGVVCGLDVVRGREPGTIVVTRGVAIDGWGREIVVPRDSEPVPVPPELADRVLDEKDGVADESRSRHRPPDRSVTVLLCYQECDGEPVSVLAGECDTAAPCAPGAVLERYAVGFEPGCADPVEVSCRFPDILRGDDIDYGALARWVTRECPDPPRDPCLPLANLRLGRDGEGCAIEDIEIEIRPVVFANPLLFDVITRVVEEQSGGDRRR